MIFSYLLNMQSHPSWVCGLKLSFILVGPLVTQSHPSWVCGLKLKEGLIVHLGSGVTPFVGVWIETSEYVLCTRDFSLSHPSWVCGLKQD